MDTDPLLAPLNNYLFSFMPLPWKQMCCNLEVVNSFVWIHWSCFLDLELACMNLQHATLALWRADLPGCGGRDKSRLYI